MNIVAISETKQKPQVYLEIDGTYLLVFPSVCQCNQTEATNWKHIGERIEKGVKIRSNLEDR